MTLEPIAGSFRPGGPTLPQLTPGWVHQFLAAEQDSTAVLMNLYRQARLELETFIREGDLTVSDADFYRKLLNEVNRVGTKLNEHGAEWVSSTIPEAYRAAWSLNSSTLMPTKAIEALSKSTLSLIKDTTAMQQNAIRQAVGTSIIEGLNGDAIRSRILSTGLQNIDHWPTVEYRAGVIARTETMSAFNAGNVASIMDTGAQFVRWIASPDEATCHICAPRDGMVFRVQGEIGGVMDPYGPAVRSLPKIPAHPRCRCTVRAEFRGPDGRVIQQAQQPPPTPPEIPSGLMGGDKSTKAPLPPAVGDFDKALAQLSADVKKFQNGGTLDSKDFWRTVELDDAKMRKIAGLEGGTIKAAKERTGDVMLARYGITFARDAAWTPAGMRASLSALERWRAVSERYVVDSPYLTHWGFAPFGARRMTGSRAAEMYATCHMRPNFTAIKNYAKIVDGYNIGIEDTIENVLTHELGHSIHNRFGLHSSTSYPAIEFGGQFWPRNVNAPALSQAEEDTIRRANIDAAQAHRERFEAPWAAIRKQSTSGVAPTASGSDIQKLRERIVELERQVAERSLPGKDFLLASTKRSLEAARQTLAKAEAALTDTGEFYPTDYARKGGYAEDFAESAMLYLLNPARLKRYSPARYQFLRDNVFGGKGG